MFRQPWKEHVSAHLAPFFEHFPWSKRRSHFFCDSLSLHTVAVVVGAGSAAAPHSGLQCAGQTTATRPLLHLFTFLLQYFSLFLLMHPMSCAAADATSSTASAKIRRMLARRAVRRDVPVEQKFGAVRQVAGAPS